MSFEVLITLVFLNLAATIMLWREAARKPQKLKKKFVTALLNSTPIAAKHEPPKNFDEDFPSLVTESDRLFFEDFTDFGAVVNWWLADECVGGPWRLQELPDTELKLDLSDSPDFGRRCAIFHNQVRVGTLEVSPSWNYNAAKPEVYTKIELNWIRLFSFDSVQSFLTGIALHVCNPDPNTKEYSETRQNIDRALMEVLWETQKFDEFDLDIDTWGELELRLNGLVFWYITRRRALNNRENAA